MQQRGLLIYNLFPLLAGPFNAWRQHLERAAKTGFTWAFVNPIQKTGESGSLYAVADYFSFNPLLIDSSDPGSAEQQVRQAIRCATDLEMRIMIDLVVNHCSIDSDLIRTHPDWFEWESDGEIAHPSCLENGKEVVWGDLAKFDHQHTKDPEGLYRFILDMVRYLLSLGFSGFRCDAAYQVPVKVWKRLIRDVRSVRPEVCFTAETLGCTPTESKATASAGFDYIFNSSKWWDFKAPWLVQQYELLRGVVPSISFPESHDTPRLCEELQGNIAGLKQRYLFAAVYSAGLMMPIGYEFGFRKKLHVVKTRPQDWEETGIDLSSFIADVNRTKLAHPILQEESRLAIIQNGNPNVLILWKGSRRQEALLILNEDISHRQLFRAENLRRFFQMSTTIVDVSPEKRMDSIPEPFVYDLAPGQGLLFVTPSR